MNDVMKSCVKRIIPRFLYEKLSAYRRKKYISTIGDQLIKSKDAELQLYGQLIKAENELRVYYGKWTKQWEAWDFDVTFAPPHYCTEYKTMIDGSMKRLYFKESWDEKKCREWYKAIVMEQDQESPHCYFNEGFFDRNDLYGTVLDIGCAEGNFALSVIDRVEKIYYFEPDKTWESAIQRTFQDYQEKLVWVKKAVGKESFDNVISIDDYFGEMIPTNISLVKMDIDGYEADALKGMKRTLKFNPMATLLICVYHHQTDEGNITKLLRDMGYAYQIRKGYMLFHSSDFVYPYLRRGVIEAKFRERKNG